IDPKTAPLVFLALCRHTDGFCCFTWNVNQYGEKGFARREGCHRYEYILSPNAPSARYEWHLQRRYRYFSQKDSCPSGQHQTASHPIWNPCEGCLHFDRSLINALGLEDAP